MKRVIVLLLSLIFNAVMAQSIRVGAKHFNEGYILSEIISQLLESEGYSVERKYNLGGTLVCFEALKNGAIDIYPEYSGTVASEILKVVGQITYQSINEQLRRQRLELSQPYGFNNTYALVIRRSLAREKNIIALSDLKSHPELRAGISYEFLKRRDGWDNLSKEYGITQVPAGLEHGLAYEALNNGKIDLTDAYSTDGEIEVNDLVVLKDDLNFFPVYEGASFYRTDLDNKTKQILSRLNHTITEGEMQAMNAAVLYDKKSFAEVASSFLNAKKLVTHSAVSQVSPINDLLDKALRHLVLTFSSLLLAIMVAVPCGVLLYWYPYLSRPVLYITGLLQTIPSIALLAMMIPLFGIGMLPAVAALFLYALLPVLRNTITGLQGIDPLLKKVAAGIGMNRAQQLRWVELPLALPVIVAGVRIAAVINVGTATLAAFIGAGGLGEYIVTGLALNNTALILRGALPAAALALLVELLFEVIEARKVRKPEKR